MGSLVFFVLGVNQLKQVLLNIQKMYEYLENLGPKKSFKLFKKLGYERIATLSLKIDKDRLIYLSRELS